MRKALVSDHAAAFDALYVATWGIETNDSTDRTFTSAPPPLSRRTGANAWAICIGPKKFVSSSARAASTAPGASDGKRRPMPALLTTMETSPHERAAAAMSSALFTSSRTGITSRLVMVVLSRAAA